MRINEMNTTELEQSIELTKNAIIEIQKKMVHCETVTERDDFERQIKNHNSNLKKMQKQLKLQIQPRLF